MALGNRTLRILVALISIPILIAVTYIGKIPFLIFVLFLGLAAYYELVKMGKHKEINANLPVGVFSIIAIILNAYLSYTPFLILIIAVSSTLLITELFRNKGSAINNLGVSLLGIFYIGLFSSSLINIREFYNTSELVYYEGGYLIIAIFISIWVCDSAAYFIGSAVGKHKLFPRVSPNKSWEGAIAGFIFAVVTLIAAHALLLDEIAIKDAIVIGIIVGVFGQVGDLVESLLKRDAGVKDSSSIIPGHGGIFDRFDSILFSAPIIYLYIHFFVQ
ncbi:MAG: phosphatidate cytidylyltransferase [Ignavibacteriae bacterium]|nr:phosphatidate cytidylyltransferase [Ignavibacteriota bacterium]NOG99837.1 phosphatidate cytidylyltransferase [Ignavibacteriota bacterium]